MTKTCTKIMPPLRKIRLGGGVQLEAVVVGSFVWSAAGGLGHWDLFEIWYLVLGILMILVERRIFAKLTKMTEPV